MNTSELVEIKEFLQEQLASLESYSFEMEESVCPDANEYASVVSDAAIKMAMQARTTNAIRDIQLALQKLSYEGYGYCEECGDPIGLARLKARPTATLCVNCQAALESSH